MNGIQIETGVPLPVMHCLSKYPFGKMNVGDSFATEAFTSARNASAGYGMRHGMKFKSQKDKGKKSGRIWRIA